MGILNIDFSETFSPVVRPSTIHLVISLAISRGWDLRRLDVKKVVLHDFLNEEVYMSQPQGFADPNFSNHICKVQKTLYRLKQAPGTWFSRFSSFLLSYGFHNCRANTSLFVFHRDSHYIILLLYVDDIIVTCTNLTLLNRFIHILKSQFSMNDLLFITYWVSMLQKHQMDFIYLKANMLVTSLPEHPCLVANLSAPLHLVLDHLPLRVIYFLILRNIVVLWVLCSI